MRMIARNTLRMKALLLGLLWPLSQGSFAQQQLPTHVTAASLVAARDDYRYQEASASTVAVKNATDASVVEMEKFTVVESYQQRMLAKDIAKMSQTLRSERFNWREGGLLYRKVGKRITIESGVWSEGPKLKLLKISW